MIVIRSYSVAHPAGTLQLPRSPNWDQLVYASRGVVRLSTAESTWVLPPLRAAWVPAGIEHRCVVTVGTRMRTLYVRNEIGLLPPETAVLELSALARELVLHLVDTAPHQATSSLTGSQLEVLASVLERADVLPLALPTPEDDPAAAVAAMLVDDPGSPLSVDELAYSVGVSRRTLERSYLASTGLSIGRWRQQLRLVAGLERLAAGEPVGTVAAALGYSTQSAFGAMFKGHLGCSPGAYFAGSSR